MSEAPREIWIEYGPYYNSAWVIRGPEAKDSVKYVRADLHEAEIAYYKERACCDPVNKWGHTRDCKLTVRCAEALNLCGHTGYESAACEICGYPDPCKLIATLKDRLKHKNTVIEMDDKEIWRLKERIDSLEKQNEIQQQIVGEAKVEIDIFCAALEIVQANYDIYTPEIVKTVVDEALK